MSPAEPTVVSRHSSPEERLAALHQIYRQVLERQPYAAEHKQLAKAEKDFLSDKIGVRRFLKELGHSEVYLNAFYYSASNMKFLETCLKHFLGRAPLNQEEVHAYCDVLLQRGVKEMITAILDSEEYRKVFGCFTVPYVREQRCYDSPKAYLESQMLRKELHGQRGWIVPTMYWHELKLNCDAGVCHPEAEAAIAPSPIPVKISGTPEADPFGFDVASADEDEISQLLKLLETAEAIK